jgi:FkbM family methyltransferase
MNLSLIQQYFHPGTVLDIGANIGQFRKIAQLTFPSAYIFSIEANPACEPYLEAITPNYYIGLLAKDNSEYDFYGRTTDPIGTGNSVYRELTHFYSADQLQVIKQQGIKLDDLFTKDSTFDLIKIDTQGSELDIMTGGRNLCKRAKAILLEVSLTKYNEGAPLYDEVLQYMDEFGFEKRDILDEAYNHGSHQQDILFVNKDI